MFNACRVSFEKVKKVPKVMMVTVAQQCECT